ncbi:MAG: hypothetical protein H6648_06880 [Caldilineae bacterium]|nr:hypothetical protein [Caldilineae bacterium]
MSDSRLAPAYPSPEHAAAAAAVVDFFRDSGAAEAVLLTNSCARGRASRDSCLDMAVLLTPATLAARGAALEMRWQGYQAGAPVFRELEAVGAFSALHLNMIDGLFSPAERDETGGPDGFELEVGNFLAYSMPLWKRGELLAMLRRHWLPYYDDSLRRERLAMARRYCLDDLHHIPLYVDRGLHFQSFQRLWDALRGFLQALFISRRTYPIAYDKWIREQLVEILGEPELYGRLVGLIELERLESRELVGKAWQLEQLLERYAPAEEAAVDRVDASETPARLAGSSLRADDPERDGDDEG